VRVDLDRAANTLEIEWEDGAVTRYQGDRLRWACPCAECRGEGGTPGRLAVVDGLPADEERLDQAGLIGQYALMLGFRSGHATGIYTFKYLRELEGG
jgi:DUF971 family protein